MGNVGLNFVLPDHLDAPTVEELPQARQQVLAQRQIHAQQTRDGLASQVVIGRSQPARDHEDIRLLQGQSQLSTDGRLLIRHAIDTDNRQTDSPKLTLDVGGVRIDGLAAQQLIADTDDAGLLVPPVHIDPTPPPRRVPCCLLYTSIIALTTPSRYPATSSNAS